MIPVADERVARLYGLPLDRFTAERNALAAALSSEGDRDSAGAVKALRKPTAAAWAVNQLVRAEPDLVEALLGAGGELRQAHRQAASGKGSLQLRAAADAERAAVDALVSRAPAALGRPLSAATLDAIRNSLHAASSDDEARERVRTGTLTLELRPIGLGPIPLAAASSGRGRAGDRSAAAEKKRRAELARALKAARTSETALRREVDEAARALERADQARVRAREAADAAAERAQEARARLREAQSGLAAAQRKRTDLETGS
jgi:hypothetical protein